MKRLLTILFIIALIFATAEGYKVLRTKILTMQLQLFNPSINTLEVDRIKNIFVSFSGGASSAMLLLRTLVTHKDANILVCFANTGDEHEETLKFVKRIQDMYWNQLYWLEAYVSPIKGKGVMPVIVDFESASRDGKPLLDQSKKLGHAAISAPHCTRDLKVRMMHKFAKAYFNGKPYITMQGIRADEASRINWGTAAKRNWEYPLAKQGITKAIVIKFWETHKERVGFKLNIKEHQGNCNLCFKKSEKKIIQSLIEKPCLIIFRITLELCSATDKHDQFRKNRTALDYLELAIETKDNNNIDSLEEYGGACFCS